MFFFTGMLHQKLPQISEGRVWRMGLTTKYFLLLFILPPRKSRQSEGTVHVWVGACFQTAKNHQQSQLRLAVSLARKFTDWGQILVLNSGADVGFLTQQLWCCSVGEGGRWYIWLHQWNQMWFHTQTLIYRYYLIDILEPVWKAISKTFLSRIFWF